MWGVFDQKMRAGPSTLRRRVALSSFIVHYGVENFNRRLRVFDFLLSVIIFVMSNVKSCGTIIVDNGKVLLVGSAERGDGMFWGFPKGDQEVGESDIETALRETKEEVGLDVEITNAESIEVSHPCHGGQDTKLIRLFEARLVGDAKIVRQEDEIDDVKWVSFDDASEMLTEHNKEAWREFLARR